MSTICKYYEKRINDEIAAGEYMQDYVLKSALQQRILTPGVKKTLKIPECVPATMFDVSQKAYDLLPRVRFVYFMSLVEAFFIGYFSERERVSSDQVRASIKNEQSKWDSLKNGSSSFYNLPFVLFVIHEKYGLNLDSVVQPVFLETGILRNCLVHHDGILQDQYFVDGLKHTLSLLGISPAVGGSVCVNKTLMPIYIDNFRKLLGSCDFP